MLVKSFIPQKSDSQLFIDIGVFLEKKLFFGGTKNAENDYFNQHLGCVAPKHW